MVYALWSITTVCTMKYHMFSECWKGTHSPALELSAIRKEVFDLIDVSWPHRILWDLVLQYAIRHVKAGKNTHENLNMFEIHGMQKGFSSWQLQVQKAKKKKKRRLTDEAKTVTYCCDTLTNTLDWNSIPWSSQLPRDRRWRSLLQRPKRSLTADTDAKTGSTRKLSWALVWSGPEKLWNEQCN